MTDDELDAAFATLPPHGPTPDFADRVMARVAVRQPMAARRPSLAVTASLALVVIGSMLASIIWTLHHLAALMSLARRTAAETSTWVSNELQAVAQSALGREIATHPGYAALALVLGLLIYSGGLFVLFRLMAGPTSSRVVYARH